MRSTSYIYKKDELKIWRETRLLHFSRVNNTCSFSPPRALLVALSYKCAGETQSRVERNGQSEWNTYPLPDPGNRKWKKNNKENEWIIKIKCIFINNHFCLNSFLTLLSFCPNTSWCIKPGGSFRIAQFPLKLIPQFAFHCFIEVRRSESRFNWEFVKQTVNPVSLCWRSWTRVVCRERISIKE